MVFMPGKDSKSKPPPVFLIPVADYKQFLEAWDAKPADKDKIIEVKIGGETMLVAQRGGYAAIAPKELRHGLEKLLAAKRSIADEYPQMLPWLTENDAVAVGTSSGIKLASKAMQEQLQQMKDIFARMNMDEDTPSPVMVMEMYATFCNGPKKRLTLSALRPGRSAGRRPRHLGTRFVKNSALWRRWPAPAERQGPAVPVCPAGPFLLAGGGVWSDSLRKASRVPSLARRRRFSAWPTASTIKRPKNLPSRLSICPRAFVRSR